MTRISRAVFTVVACLALPVYAQRGQGGFAGRSSGTSGHTPASLQGGYPAPGRSASPFAPQSVPVGSAQFGPSHSTGFSSHQRNLVHPGSVGYHDFRSGENRDTNYRDDRYRRPYRSYFGSGLPYSVGWLDLGYPGYLDQGFYDNSGGPTPQPPPNSAIAASEAPPAEYASPDAPSFRPSYQRPQPAADPGTEAAVTLIFKDGRPPEEIRNYILTRKTLYVQEQRLREIPVDQLDLPATEKFNQNAGVEFRLPDPSR